MMECSGIRSRGGVLNTSKSYLNELVQETVRTAALPPQERCRGRGAALHMSDHESRQVWDSWQLAGCCPGPPITPQSPQPVCFGACLGPGRPCEGAPKGGDGHSQGAGQACRGWTARPGRTGLPRGLAQGLLPRPAHGPGGPACWKTAAYVPPPGPHVLRAPAAQPVQLVPASSPGVPTPLCARHRAAHLRTARRQRVASSRTSRPPLRPGQPRPGRLRLALSRSPTPVPPAPGLHTGPSPLPSTLPRYLPGWPPGGSSVSAQTSPAGCEPLSPHLQTEHGLNPRALKSGSREAPRAVARQWAVVRPCLCAPCGSPRQGQSGPPGLPPPRPGGGLPVCRQAARKRPAQAPLPWVHGPELSLNQRPVVRAASQEGDVGWSAPVPQGRARLLRRGPGGDSSSVWRGSPLARP